MSNRKLIQSKRLADVHKMTPDELKQFMDYQGLSVNDFAQILGVTTQAITLWRTGQREISVTNTRLFNMFIKYPKLLREF